MHRTPVSIGKQLLGQGGPLEPVVCHPNESFIQSWARNFHSSPPQEYESAFWALICLFLASTAMVLLLYSPGCTKASLQISRYGLEGHHPHVPATETKDLTMAPLLSLVPMDSERAKEVLQSAPQVTERMIYPLPRSRTAKPLLSMTTWSKLKTALQQ